MTIRMGNAQPHSLPFEVKLAYRSDEIEQALRLRYQVFVEEERNLRLMNDSGLEQDRYDEFCDHLIVKDLNSQAVVGTYRLLPGPRVLQHCGFYSETEFDLSRYEDYKWNTLELGRSCVAAEYRNGRVIQLLWEGIADYIKQKGYRYLIGCASLHMGTIKELNELYTMLAVNHVITDRFGITPLETHRIPGLQLVNMELGEKELFRRLPPLMKGYKWLGAEIGGEPAYDEIFDTADFFIILEAEKITNSYKKKFLR